VKLDCNTCMSFEVTLVNGSRESAGQSVKVGLRGRSLGTDDSQMFDSHQRATNERRRPLHSTFLLYHPHARRNLQKYDSKQHRRRQPQSWLILYVTPHPTFVVETLSPPDTAFAQRRLRMSSRFSR
jgi:hypothetical protein